MAIITSIPKNLIELTGRNVEHETIFMRNLRTSTTGAIQITRKLGAKGFIAYLIVHGATGTFEMGEGVRMRLRTYASSLSNICTSQTTEYTNVSGRSHTILLYPGVSSEGHTASHGASLLAISGLATRVMSLQIEIEGTFDVGQGIDCEVVLEWLI